MHYYICVIVGGALSLPKNGSLVDWCKNRLAQFLKRIMSATKPLVIFVLGGPGVGKGTQCGKIVEVNMTCVTMVQV